MCHGSDWPSPYHGRLIAHVEKFSEQAGSFG